MPGIIISIAFGGVQDLIGLLCSVTKGQIMNTKENNFICVLNKWDTHIEQKVVMTLNIT